MNDVFLLVQLSDPHIGGTWGRGDPVANLAEVVKTIDSLGRVPDAVVISGDLADHGADAEYEQVRELLGPLDAPIYALPGNHDDRDALRRHSTFRLRVRTTSNTQSTSCLRSARLVIQRKREGVRGS